VKLATVARLRSSSSRTRRAFRRRLSSATRRSSASVISTRVQSSGMLESASKKRAGVLPPDTTSSAAPLSAIAARSRSAVYSASSSARSSPSAKSRRLNSIAILVFLIPGSSVALDQRHRGVGSPRAGRVRAGRLLRLAPGVAYRIDESPCGLDLVAPHEEGRIAADCVHQQTLVGVRRGHAEGFGETQVEREVYQPRGAG